MREVFGDFDPTEHVAEAEARWVDTDGYRESARRTKKYGKKKWLAIQAEAAAIEEAMAAAMRGAPPDLSRGDDGRREAPGAHHPVVLRGQL